MLSCSFCKCIGFSFATLANFIANKSIPTVLSKIFPNIWLGVMMRLNGLFLLSKIFQDLVCYLDRQTSFGYGYFFLVGDVAIETVQNLIKFFDFLVTFFQDFF
jgi:hypothetical protein